jgi:alkaline phosphatase
MNKEIATNRRQFLKLSGLAGAASLLTGGATQGATTGMAGTANGAAKSVIFLVVDGLSHGTLGLANQWKLRHQQSIPNWLQLLERSDLNRSLQDTASANSPVTDSAAAGSAWGCGQRVNNGTINYDTLGKPRKPILSYAKEAGKRTGLVTTCRITHATPAAFAVNVEDRGMEDAIARQYLDRGIDVLLGGGARYFTKNETNGGVVDYRTKFREAGYTLLSSRDDLASAASKQRMLGLFSESHIPYAIDRKNDRSLAQVPGLPEMFKAALASLSGSKEGFFLQVEGGRVDHAGHANDAGAILHEYLEYDACIPVALDYVAHHPDTLLIVTTDHGTGGCQLNGQGKQYLGSGPALDRINSLQYSFEWLQNRFRAAVKFDEWDFTQATGIQSTSQQAAIVQRALDNEAEYLSEALVEAFGEQLEELTAVGWSSNKHTAECVDLFAMGPGSGSIPAYLKNYELFGKMMAAMGLSAAS